MEQKKAESDSKQVFMGERESESQGSPASSLAKTTGVHLAAILVTGTKCVTGEKRFPQFLPLQRKGRTLTTAHQGTCLFMKVTLSVL